MWRWVMIINFSGLSRCCLSNAQLRWSNSLIPHRISNTNSCIIITHVYSSFVVVVVFQTLFVNDEILLCDCPGLVFPSFVSTKADMILNGILPIDQMRDHVPPVSLISCIYDYLVVANNLIILEDLLVTSYWIFNRRLITFVYCMTNPN